MLRHDWTMIGTDGAELYVREWRPADREAAGVVCILHGMGEHGERYARLAEGLAEAGLASVVPDQRGHGRTPGKRGHLPAHAAMSDTEVLLREISDKFDGLPVFLYGHSMGGNIALNSALRKRLQVRGLILSSPWLRLAFQPPAVKLWLGRGIARLLPEFAQKTGLRQEDLYRKGYVQEEADSYTHGVITAATYFDLAETGEWALAHAEGLSCPLLLLHGTADKITSWEASAELAGRLGDRCRFLSWQGGLHELHNDIEGRDVIRAITDWLQYQL